MRGHDASETPEGAPVLSQSKVPIPHGRHDFVALRAKRDVSESPGPAVNKRLRPVNQALHLPRMRAVLQRPDLPLDLLAQAPRHLPKVARGLVSCSGYRQLAASLDVSPQTIARHAARLGKQALLFHEEMRKNNVPDEPLALDSFVSFVYSQYFPIHFHFVMGRESHFAYGFTESEVRRSGTMTRAQRVRREHLERELGRPDPKAREIDVAAILRIIANGASMLDLTTDEDQAYPRAIRRSGLAVNHSTISSKERRTTGNPLFASNLHDLQVRHGSANHKRETISFSKTIRSAIERMWLHLVWKNYVKPFSEKTRGPTPAQRAGVTDHKGTWREIFRRRRFPGRIVLPERWQAHFQGITATRAFGAVEENPLAFAY
jgi:hypothetical protein